jgi:hypothetical protein
VSIFGINEETIIFFRLSVVDSSSRIPSGIARGNVVPMGNYDECLAIEEVPTKFCKAALQLNLPSEVPKLKRIVSLLFVRRQEVPNRVFVEY